MASEHREIGRLLGREDWVFLELRLAHLSPDERATTKAEYKRRFLAAMDQEPVEYKKANAGRRAANEWLLEHTDRADRE